MTLEIRKLVQVRDRLFARKKRDPDNLAVKQAYNRVHNKVEMKFLSPSLVIRNQILKI